jgi:hypothetical protein
VTHLHEFEEIIKILEQISSGKMDYGRKKTIKINDKRVP